MSAAGDVRTDDGTFGVSRARSCCALAGADTLRVADFSWALTRRDTARAADSSGILGDHVYPGTGHSMLARSLSCSGDRR